MKLNHSCVRELLLYIEKNAEYSSLISVEAIELSGYSLEEIAYTTKKLKEAGYINADFRIYEIENLCAFIEDITWEGHKFLDTIRDNAVWSKTKKIISKFSSVPLSLVSNVASQVLTNLINQELGITPISALNSETNG